MTKTVHLPPLYPYQQEIKEHPARFKVLAIGRRAGKSFFAMMEAMDRAINMGQNVWIVYPSFPTSEEHWQSARDRLGEANFIKDINVSKRFISFHSGGKISFKSADKYHNLRGSGLDFVVLDEAAFMKEEVFTSIILPALADRNGSALIISTPFGQNWFWKVFKYGESDQFPEWASWQYPSTINPKITTKERDLQKKIMPRHEFLREWMASFEGTGGGAFVDFAKTLVLPPLDPNYVFKPGQCDVGIDWGRKNDYTVVSGFDWATREQKLLERFTDIGFEAQASKVVDILKKVKPRNLFVEYNHIGMVMFEMLARRIKSEVQPVNPGLRLYKVEMTNTKKQTLVDHYSTLIEQGYITHFSEEHEHGVAQSEELSGYSLEHTASGLALKYGNDSSVGHDDIVVANMLAVQKIPIPVVVEGTSYAFGGVDNPFY